ncbi:nuclear pore complex protein Nup205-like [Lineus longissimus]|uniref:nuclear pore complex protein Nup205-like n=1 Tax=Lineus longissimus TaxID=88925 RepID=UPI00315C573B
MALNQDARMWSAYKELYSTVDAAINKKQPDAIHDLGVALKKHKPVFLSLLTNPAKNATYKEDVKKATTEGLPIAGQQGKQVLSQAFVDESLIISDLFELNEFAAVELLIAGENQLPYFPGLTRGLVAVLLYYDGKRCLVNSLRSLMQAREGRTWTLDLNQDLVMMTTKFTQELMAEDLTMKILELTRTFELTSEIEKMQKQRGLGKAKHRKEVTDFIKEIRLSLVESLFNWSCQTGLSRADTIAVIRHLKNNCGLNADGTLDSVTLCLLMAALYCFDVSILDQEEGEELIKKLPIVSDEDYIGDIHNEVTSEDGWTNKGIKAVLQFAWAQTLRTLSQQNLGQVWGDYCEQDENIAETAIQDGAFSFLKEAVIGSEVFHNEEFYVRRLHGIIIDFLVQMPLKVKELRNRGDETARIVMAHLQEGLTPPSNLPRDFEQLLCLLGDFYYKDPLHLELSLEYWCPIDPALSPGGGGSFASRIHHRPPQRQISLYKFIRLAGDLLPPVLYIPYVRMLRGLANGAEAAHHCYNLLKANGTSYGGQASTVSWDHFFASFNQYLTSLRQEYPSGMDVTQIYRHAHHRGITPQELDGLVSVLQLMRCIAEQDESARVALCENQQWMSIFLFFGLLACSIPAVLKGEILQTLAAFAKTAEIGLTLWQSLESSQIIPTVSSTSMQQSGGMKIELDEVEARNEEFPMTTSFMKLVGSLTNIPIPAGLGAGYRAPGFDPYLDFIRDCVFLKFNTRAYKNPAEKWAVAVGALELFHKLLLQYEMVPEDFVDTHADMQVGGKSPGYSLMIHLMNDGGLLKMVLFIIDEVVRNLDLYTTYPGKANMDKAALFCLKMIATVLNRQDQFLDLLRDGGSSALVSPLDKLLLGVNPRTAKADHMVNVVRYISHNSTNPEHALAAVQILYHVCQTPKVQQELVGLFTVNEDLYQIILHGFVECLEADDPEVIEEEDVLQTGEDPSVSQIRNATRQSIMKLLLQSVDQASPNIAHCLLGFELRKPVYKTNLQDPGVLRSPRTCLHSILSVIEHGVGSKSGPTCMNDTPVLAELCYHLIYMLCANKDTSDPTMRYLRTTYDFFYRHLQHLPFSQAESRNRDLILLQQAWLVKTIAIELRLTSINRQRSNTQRLMKLLLDDSPVLPSTGNFGLDQDATHFDLDQTAFHRTQVQQNKTFMAGGQTKQKILLLLETIGLAQGLEFPSMPMLEFFDRESIEQFIESQEVKNERGIRYCSVKTLHNLMMNELNNNLQGSAAATQRRIMIDEIQQILAVVVDRNNMRESLHAKKCMFDAWRHVVEILLTACPVELLAGEERQSIIFELLQDLFMEISSEDALSELTVLAASVILTLLANLRQCFISDQLTEMVGEDLEDASNEEGSNFGQKKGSRTLFASSLQVVLKGLIDHILRTSGGLQRVRANLYGALLYCLQIAQKPVYIPSLELGGQGDHPVLSRISNKESECEKLMRENMETIVGYGDSFMEVVCRDACDGHEVGRMLALSALDAIISADKSLTWLSFMQSKGYLQHLIDSLLHEDEKLQTMLSPNPEPLKALYIYESKMSLLTRLAGTATGANALLRCGVMGRLSECIFLDLRPDVPSQHGQGMPPFEGFLPTILARYRQLLFPALQLCLSIMTSLGVENRDAANQVLKAVAAHIDVFNAILREQHTTLNLSNLQELALVTAVISRAAADGDEQEFLFKDVTSIEMHSHFSRIQRQLLSLLSRFCTMEKVDRHLKNMEEDVSSDGKDLRGELVQAVLEVSCNVLAYCRTVVAKSAPDAKHCRILFGPSLTEVTSRDMHGVDELHSSITGAYRPPTLGIIVIYLKQYTDHFIHCMDQYKQNMRKLKGLNELSSDELKELSGIASSEKISVQQRQKLAKKRLVQMLKHKVQEVKQCSYLIENSLFLLWRHLDYYFMFCRPYDQGNTLFKLNARKEKQMRRLTELPGSGNASEIDYDDIVEESATSSLKVTKEEIDKLKQDAVACINDSLFKKLQEIEQCYTKNYSRYGFMEGLVRRLKRLLRLHSGINC